VWPVVGYGEAPGAHPYAASHFEIGMKTLTRSRNKSKEFSQTLPFKESVSLSPERLSCNSLRSGSSLKVQVEAIKTLEPDRECISIIDYGTQPTQNKRSISPNKFEFKRQK